MVGDIMADNQSNHSIVAGPGEVADPNRVQTRLEIEKALSGSGFGDLLVLSYESVREVFTPKRREIIEVLATERVSSVRDLADRLDRNPGNVSRELDLLVEHEVVGYIDNGTAKQPVLAHDTIISEPLVVSSEPRSAE